MFALRVPCDHPPTHYCLSWDDASSAPSLLSVLSATAAPSQHKNNKLQPYKPQFKSSPVHWTESYCRRHLQLYRLYNGPTRWTQSQYSSWIANSKFTQSARISQQNHWWCEMSHFLYDSVSTHCPVGTNPLRDLKKDAGHFLVNMRSLPWSWQLTQIQKYTLWYNCEWCFHWWSFLMLMHCADADFWNTLPYCLTIYYNSHTVSMSKLLQIRYIDILSSIFTLIILLYFLSHWVCHHQHIMHHNISPEYR